MRTRFVEATQGIEGGFNWGKFMVGSFDEEELADEAKYPFGWFLSLPSLVELPDAPGSMQGYRRAGE